jgi:hypothetical protein
MVAPTNAERAKVTTSSGAPVASTLVVIELTSLRTVTGATGYGRHHPNLDACQSGVATCFRGARPPGPDRTPQLREAAALLGAAPRDDVGDADDAVRLNQPEAVVAIHRGVTVRRHQFTPVPAR